MILHTIELKEIKTDTYWCDFCPEGERSPAYKPPRGCCCCKRHMCVPHCYEVILPDADSPDQKVLMCPDCYSESDKWFKKWIDENKRHEKEIEEIEASWVEACRENIDRQKSNDKT